MCRRKPDGLKHLANRRLGGAVVGRVAVCECRFATRSETSIASGTRCSSRCGSTTRCRGRRFFPSTPTDPTRVQLAASDDTSGVASVEIEARRRGDFGMALAARLRMSVSGTRRALDDDRLPPGAYELRARVIDRAGNERTTDETCHLASRLTVQLPIRVASALAVGPSRAQFASVAPRASGRSTDACSLRSLRRSTASPSRSKAGSTDPSAILASDAIVDVLERVNLPGRDWQQIASIRTNACRRLHVPRLPGPTRQLRFLLRRQRRRLAHSAEDVELARARRRQRWSRTGVASPTVKKSRSAAVFSGTAAAGWQVARPFRLDTARGWRTFATPVRARPTAGSARGIDSRRRP